MFRVWHVAVASNLDPFSLHRSVHASCVAFPTHDGAEAGPRGDSECNTNNTKQTCWHLRRETDRRVEYCCTTMAVFRKGAEAAAVVAPSPSPSPRAATAARATTPKGRREGRSSRWALLAAAVALPCCVRGFLQAPQVNNYRCNPPAILLLCSARSYIQVFDAVIPHSDTEFACR